MNGWGDCLDFYPKLVSMMDQFRLRKLDIL